MAIASSIIEDVARYLSDYDEAEAYVHWTEEDLQSYFRYAMSIVATVKKERFVKRTEIPLREGAYQEVPEECAGNVSIVGYADDNGIVQGRIRKAKLSQYTPLGRPMCKAESRSSNYKLGSYEYDPTDSKTIIIDPPAPEGAEGSIVITCYQPPKFTTFDEDTGLGAEYDAVIFELMLYYAWGVDIEDNASRERSNQHWNNAITLLGLNRQQEAEARRVARQ